MSTEIFFTLACAGMIAFLFGLALTFAGYKFFMVLIPVWGFFFGFWLGAQSMQALFNAGFLATITSWTVGFIVGAVFAGLAYLFYFAAVAIIAGSLGYYVAVGLLMWLGLPMGFLVWIIGIVAAIALAAVTLIFNLQKWVIIIATAVLGAGAIIGVFIILFNPVAGFLQNPVRLMLQTSPLLMFVFLALVIFGIIVQSRPSRSLAASEAATPPVPIAAPAAVAGGGASGSAAAGAAGIAAVSYEARQEPAPVEYSAPPTPAAVIPAAVDAAAETAAETPLAATPTELTPTEAVSFGLEAAPSEPKVIPTDLDEPAKFKYNLEYIEGIGPAYAAKLNGIGIANLGDLLEKGAFPKGREEIAEAAGISPKLVLKWVNHVDLFRIKGVGSEYADLLEMAGVDTVVELATRNADNLFAKLLSVNEEKNLVRKLPVLGQVQEWIEQAKGLPRMINY